MFRTLLLLLLPPVTLAAAVSPRIIGGSPVSITDYPYQLSVRYRSSHICGGAILNEKVAISAAHCFQRPGPYSIKAGSSHLEDKDGVVIHIERALIHPNFTKVRNDYDICLLFLASPLTLSERIKPVKLPSQNDVIKEGVVGVVSGWGATATPVIAHSDKLMAVELPTWQWEKCNKAYFSKLLTKRMFCAGLQSGGKDSCKGDSGGPFVVQGVLMGVVSSGVGCAEGSYPGIYTSVPVLRSFIKEYAGL